MSDLESRLELLLDERDVLRTLHAYGHAIDYGDEEAWVDCFTEDAHFGARGRVNHDVRGREALREFISRHSRAPESWHKHLMVEPLIDVDGDTATVASYFVVTKDVEGAPRVTVFGRYRDRLVREADGRWRFAERLAEAESYDSSGKSLVRPPKPRAADA